MATQSKLHPVIMIPSRLTASRFPNKPLALIHGKPMIWHVVQRALESKVGDVFVAAADQEILDAIQGTGAQGILTDPNHPSGSDRIAEALAKIDSQGTKYNMVVNLQGDLPTLAPELIRDVLEVFDHLPNSDMATLAVPITNPAEKENPNIVKVVLGERQGDFGNALYFSRSAIPHGNAPGYHHIGMYAFRTEALKRMVQAKPSPLEKAEKLEQLRALELGMKIGIKIVKTIPLGVDVPGDIHLAEDILQS
jgi:3-deoxy-manno-octulosonate cytidylyltransferase (CMP-KDO synthetase)